MSNTLTAVLENGTTINITEADGNIVVEASVPTRILARDPKAACSTSMIVEALQEQGVETGTILSGANQTLSNSKKSKETNGRWIFETPRKARAKSRKNSRTAPRKEQPATKTEEVSKSRTNKLLGNEDME
jgi:hypothetical protein